MLSLTQSENSSFSQVWASRVDHMAMGFYLNGDAGDFQSSDLNEAAAGDSRVKPVKNTFPLLKQKLRVPRYDDITYRGRLHGLLERSCAQFGGTLVSGRSGTGKTALVAEFASGKESVAWYSVDPTDADWNVFSRYFSAAMAQQREPKPTSENIDRTFLAEYLSECLNSRVNEKKKLIVLDNAHHLFDTEWFCDFFVLLLQSLSADSHALILCRSKPPAPLWRLRSKQVLNVIDESLLAFTPAETAELCKERGISKTAAQAFHGESFGRASKLMQYINARHDQSPIL
jgi:ATP/maltotriose-dependent transcriptional regulator MalT